MTAPDPMLGRSIGPYRLLRQIGAGGMGAVYLAERVDEIKRLVAIKLIRPDLTDAEALRRFQQERQTLAHLDHPNIVRLLDGGSTPEGLPYVVMDYVEGEPIDTYCDSRRLPVRARLELFLAVCSAVQYAHQHLIVHRDLKPANLLVSRDGAVKLLDFGIAKLLIPGVAVTQAGSGPMTPEFASPEQLRGDPITTAADTYALGVILHHLVTGRSPYAVTTESPAALLHQVLTVEPARPGLGDLDDVILMALRKSPEDRYRSVEHLAEDVRRYLEGRPVQAKKGTLRYRTVKFIRRNRVKVALAVAALGAVAAGTVGTVWQAGVAQIERARAERRFNDVRRLVNLMLFELHEASAKIPGSTPLQELMVKRSLEYLDRLARDSSGDPALQSDLAEAYLKFGDIQGNPYQNNLGDTRGALASYNKARSLVEALSDDSSRGGVASRNLAKIEVHAADVLGVSGQLKEAVERTRRAIASLEKLAAAHPKDLDTRTELAGAFESLGDKLGHPGLASLGDTKGASEAYRRSVEEWQSAVSLDSRNPRSRRALATLTMKLADLQDALGDPTGAQANYRSALTMLEAAAESDEAAGRRLAGMLHRKLGVSLAEGGDPRAGTQSLEWSAEIFSGLATADPTDQRARSDLANVWLSLGDMHYRAGQTAPAIAAIAKAVDAYELLARADPSNHARREQYTYALLRAGAVLNAAGQRDEARRQTGRALALAKQSADRSDATATELERAARYFMGCEPRDLRRPREALRYAQKAVDLTKSENPAFVATLAEAQFEAGDKAGAKATALKAIEAAPAGSSERTELESRLASLKK